jgi:O-antigen/teichoic acid export membrane protein
VVTYGGPLQIGNVLAVAHQQVDKVMLSRYVALVWVAPDELGLRASTVMGSLPNIMLTALISEASALHAVGDHAGLRAAHDRAARWVMTFTAMLAAALVVGSPRLLAAWLGDVPSGSDLAVVGLSIAMVLAMATGVVAALARAFGRTRYEAEYSALAFVLHVALGLWLVPRYGLVGALVATLVANVVAVAWYLWRFARLTGWHMRTLLAPSWPPLAVLGLVAVAGRLLVARLPEAHGLIGWLWVAIRRGCARTARVGAAERRGLRHAGRMARAAAPPRRRALTRP